MGEIDNRSHAHIALYWAQALAAQDEDADLKCASRRSRKLEGFAAILNEIDATQGVNGPRRLLSPRSGEARRGHALERDTEWHYRPRT